MASKLNSVLVSSMIAFTCSLLLMWAHNSYPLLVRAVADDVGALLYYPERPAQEIRNMIHAAGNWVLEQKSLQDRNSELEAENLALRTSLQRAGVASPKTTDTLIGARVTLRYPDSWWKEIRVNKGTDDGVHVGAPVLTDGYMIGRVSSVGSGYSWIEMITSASFLLAAVVDDTWDLGVINGDDKGNVWLLYMPPEKEFDDGMRVSTALVGDYLPPGIPIGRIAGSGTPRDSFTPHRITSGADLAQLYNVQILAAGNVGGNMRQADR